MCVSMLSGGEGDFCLELLVGSLVGGGGVEDAPPRFAKELT